MLNSTHVIVSHSHPKPDCKHINMWNNKHEANNSTQTQAKQHYIAKQQFPHD